MITNRDLADIPVGARSAPAEVEFIDQATRRFVEGSLDPVQRVMTRLLARAEPADPTVRAALLADADDLEAAVRTARQVLLPEG
jgi:hypothetical protein